MVPSPDTLGVVLAAASSSDELCSQVQERASRAGHYSWGPLVLVLKGQVAPWFFALRGPFVANRPGYGPLFIEQQEAL